MHESQPGGPDGDCRPLPGHAGQPDQRPGDDWFRPQRGQPRESGPRDLPALYGGPRSLPASRPLNLPASRPINLPVSRPADRPRFYPFLRVTSVDLMALTVGEERKAGGNLALTAGTVFFLADTVLMAYGFTRPVAAEPRVLVIFVWLISVAAAALLWLRVSPKFGRLFKQISMARFTRARTGSHSRRGKAATRDNGRR